MKFAAFLVALVAAVFAFAPEQAAAQNAQKCVSIGNAKRAQTITNNCSRKIEVVWCHNKNQKGYRSGLCGRKNKFYQKHRVLKPGEEHDNRYSLPKGTRINYGACFGGYYSTKPKGSRGRYACKTRRS